MKDQKIDDVELNRYLANIEKMAMEEIQYTLARSEPVRRGKESLLNFLRKKRDINLNISDLSIDTTVNLSCPTKKTKRISRPCQCYPEKEILKINSKNKTDQEFLRSCNISPE